MYENLSKITDLKVPFELYEGNVPFGFVILTNKRDELYNYCIKQNIYCNIHWKDSKNLLSEHIMTIPCDQRYEEKDMKYIVDKVVEFFRR